jgi:hypothetical protein
MMFLVKVTDIDEDELLNTHVVESSAVILTVADVKGRLEKALEGRDLRVDVHEVRPETIGQIVRQYR